MEKYIVTIEGLKRAHIEVEANNALEAKQQIETQFAETGIETITFDEMFDSIKITNIIEKEKDTEDAE